VRRIRLPKRVSARTSRHRTRLRSPALADVLSLMHYVCRSSHRRRHRRVANHERTSFRRSCTSDRVGARPCAVVDSTLPTMVARSHTRKKRCTTRAHNSQRTKNGNFVLFDLVVHGTALVAERRQRCIDTSSVHPRAMRSHPTHLAAVSRRGHGDTRSRVDCAYRHLGSTPCK